MVSLAWSRSASSNVNGYRLYYGTSSGTYSDSIDVGDQSAFTANGLQPGQTYYFGVKAYASADGSQESGFSNEVTVTMEGG